MPQFDLSTSTAEVIAASTYRRMPGVYRYVRVREVRHPERHLLVTRDEREITVVTLSENLIDEPVLETSARSWVLFVVDCAKPFFCVGFIAHTTAYFAKAGIDVLVVSTFSRDYFMVQREHADLAERVLTDAGFAESKEARVA